MTPYGANRVVFWSDEPPSKHYRASQRGRARMKERDRLRELVKDANSVGLCPFYGEKKAPLIGGDCTFLHRKKG